MYPSLRVSFCIFFNLRLLKIHLLKRIYIYSFRPTVNNGTSIVCKLRYFTFGLNIKKSPHGFLPGIRYEDGLNNQYYSIIDPCNLWNKTWKKQNLYFGN